MKPNWDEVSLNPIALRTFVIEHVLMEYDGLQAATFTSDGACYIGVVSFMGTEYTRWIRTPLSDADRARLANGDLSFRDALLRDGALIFDETNVGQPDVTYSVDPAEIPEDALPTVGALLPSWARKMLRRKATK